MEETNHYYPFGGVFASSSSVQPYKYNGKEYDSRKALNWYDYGARYYDAALGRFATADRFAEKYSSISVYQYGANNPVNNIDINGDSIWFSHKNGELTQLTMNVTAKVLNDSRERLNMETVTNNIKTAIGRAFKGKADGVSFDTNIQLSVAESMNDVSDSDHLFVLTDKISQVKKGKIYGASNYVGGKVSFIDASYFSGLYDELLGSRNYGSFTAAHEFGHLAGLNHEEKRPFNLMRSNGMFYNMTVQQLNQIYKNWKRNDLNRYSNYIIGPMGRKRPNVGNAALYVKSW